MMMTMIIYYSISFMIDEFDDYCNNTSVNVSYCNNYLGFKNLTDKSNSYEYVLSNFSKTSPPFLCSLNDEKFIYNNYNNYLNYCVDVLILFFVTSTSLLFSILIVSICVYEKMINQFVEKYNTNRECYEYDTYFFEYLDEFNELNNTKLVDDYLNSLEYKYIKQKTPKGEVLMNYNNSNSSFDYYCKKSNTIDFMYLDVVSRIYVVKYDCKNIYIDNFDNFELIKDYYSNLTNEPSSFDELKENNIFYNRINKKNKTKQSIEYVSNKYKYRGTFDDFNSYCKNNNYKTHTQDLLENDIFVLEKNNDDNNDNNDDNDNDDDNNDNNDNNDDDNNDNDNNDDDKTILKDSSNISFKTFKNMIAMSSKN